MRALAVVAALFAVGCAEPYGDDPPRSSVPGELPAPLVQLDAAPATPARSPEAAARHAAELASNWTGETAAATYRRLARLMTGVARRQADEAAARLPSDPQLADTTSEGSVASIGTTDAGRLIIVTRETITTGGLRDTRYRTTLARAARSRGGWLLSRWEPQP